MEQKTILIADDDRDYLFQMQFQLEKAGFMVVSAESQQEAEEAIEHVSPDIAIFDLMMENEDSGFILTYKFKKKFPDVPVIISTAVTAETGFSFQPNTESEKNWIKADAYIEKGAMFSRVLNEINNQLQDS